MRSAYCSESSASLGRVDPAAGKLKVVLSSHIKLLNLHVFDVAFETGALIYTFCLLSPLGFKVSLLPVSSSVIRSRRIPVAHRIENLPSLLLFHRFGIRRHGQHSRNSPRPLLGSD